MVVVALSLAVDLPSKSHALFISWKGNVILTDDTIFIPFENILNIPPGMSSISCCTNTTESSLRIEHLHKRMPKSTFRLRLRFLFTFTSTLLGESIICIEFGHSVFI